MNTTHLPAARSGRRRLAGTLALVTGALLSACESPPTHREEGTVIGGVLGGVIGQEIGGGHGRTAATIIGTLIGAGIGGQIGRSMDDTDRLKTVQALETGRTGEPSRWVNPDTGHRYTVVPRRATEGSTGPCREYTVDGVIGGRTEKVIGQACRQADGSWRNVR